MGTIQYFGYGVLIITVFFNSATASCSCKKVKSHYLDMGCRPVYIEGNECSPQYYECDNVFRKIDNCNGTCYFQGSYYKVGEYVPNDLTESGCLTNCWCDQKDKKPFLNCKPMGCLENMCRPETFAPTMLKYELNKCCAVGVINFPFTDLPKCVVGKQTYNEGERFSVSDNKCEVCVCKRGYSGSFVEPFCRPVNCNTAIKNALEFSKFCAPIYTERECCPSSWHCGSKDTQYLGTPLQTGQVLNNNQCRFINRVFNRGEKFVLHLQGEDALCECSLPPLMSCQVTKGVSKDKSLGLDSFESDKKIFWKKKDLHSFQDDSSFEKNFWKKTGSFESNKKVSWKKKELHSFQDDSTFEKKFWKKEGSHYDSNESDFPVSKDFKIPDRKKLWFPNKDKSTSRVAESTGTTTTTPVETTTTPQTTTTTPKATTDAPVVTTTTPAPVTVVETAAPTSRSTEGPQTTPKVPQWKGHSKEKKRHSDEWKGYSDESKGHSNEKKSKFGGLFDQDIKRVTGRPVQKPIIVKPSIEWKSHSKEKKGHSGESKGYSDESKGHSNEKKQSKFGSLFDKDIKRVTGGPVKKPIIVKPSIEWKSHSKEKKGHSGESKGYSDESKGHSDEKKSSKFGGLFDQDTKKVTGGSVKKPVIVDKPKGKFSSLFKRSIKSEDYNRNKRSVKEEDSQYFEDGKVIYEDTIVEAPCGRKGGCKAVKIPQRHEIKFLEESDDFSPEVIKKVHRPRVYKPSEEDYRIYRGPTRVKVMKEREQVPKRRVVHVREHFDTRKHPSHERRVVKTIHTPIKVVEDDYEYVKEIPRRHQVKKYDSYETEVVKTFKGPKIVPDSRPEIKYFEEEVHIKRIPKRHRVVKVDADDSYETEVVKTVKRPQVVKVEHHKKIPHHRVVKVEESYETKENPGHEKRVKTFKGPKVVKVSEENDEDLKVVPLKKN